MISSLLHHWILIKFWIIAFLMFEKWPHPTQWVIEFVKSIPLHFWLQNDELYFILSSSLSCAFCQIQPTATIKYFSFSKGYITCFPASLKRQFSPVCSMNCPSISYFFHLPIQCPECLPMKPMFSILGFLKTEPVSVAG